MTKFFLTFFLIPAFFLTANLHEKISVVVVGGGPAGLACAVEAANNGCNVTVVEKREEYTRFQPVAITINSLKLLKQWDVPLPGMLKHAKDGQEWGLLRIKLLEKHLLEKCRKLHVNIVIGEFQGFESNNIIRVKSLDENINIPYDLLIAADGAHSKARQALSIPMIDFGSAKGAYVIIPDLLKPKVVGEITEVMREGHDFFRIIKLLSFATIVCFQSPIIASKDQIKDLLEIRGWKKEAKAISQGRIVELVENIPISFAQAQIFYDLERSAVLVGDAAVNLSFLLEEGLNTAFSNIPFISDLCKEFQEDKKKAFEKFNLSMKLLTDVAIEHSAFLYTP